jgi:DNA-directed RNA polymerase subunit M/transcription elongation factor TFIIS
MAETERTMTFCSNCNRVLWSTDADREGRCEDCRPSVQREREREAKAAEKEAAEAAAAAEAEVEPAE